jgi:hypothetical protein
LRIPDRTEELFTDLTFYWSVGRVWREVLEKVIPPTVQHAAELGCGYVPKASLGLHYLNYMGRVDLVDSDEAAASHARNFLELFGARFHCDTRRTTLIEAPQEAYDLVVANHLLDDLALSFYCATQGSEFTALYLDEVSYASTWRTMVADREWLPGFVDSTVSTLLRLLKPNGTVVLIDYPSFSHRALGLTTLIQFVRDAQFLLREKFMEKGARVVSDPIVKPVVCDRLRVTHEDLIVVQREVPG